jgi:hypothetical protein
MTLQKLTLTAAALGFGAFGIVLFLAPGLLGSVGVSIEDPSGTVELRAFYGGIEIGLAIFFALAARRPAWMRSALTALVFAAGGVVFLRGFALLIAGFQVKTFVYISWAAETLLFVLALLSLLKNGKESA